MYAYEGIGSIYWHMVTKLLLTVQESTVAAVAAGASPPTVERLRAGYWRIRAGLGHNKPAREFGAVPIDPYSHTPAHAGAQQPGMTGAVKEEILARPLELGLRVDDGEIVFDPLFLRADELLVRPRRWTPLSVAGERVVVELDASSCGFTFCQVPVVVGTTAGEPVVEVGFTDGRTERCQGLRVGREVSAKVFGRTAEVAWIRARLPVG